MCNGPRRASRGSFPRVQRGAPTPDISSAETLTCALISADTIVVSESSSGIYFRTELLPKLGFREQVWPRVRTVADELPGFAVARGEARIVVEQLSELVVVDGVEVAGLLPESLQQHLTVGVALGGGHPTRRGARELIAFLASPQQRGVLRAAGMKPSTAAP
ncbi:molybdate ABC transporter substrate-binding protein [Mycobacterium sp.]|uniref:molybdate ABC transporter substrate-binding protein n=1 Tax=Mycobacterium sp. TaxID=1785 RepID=UPI003D0F2CE8